METTARDRGYGEPMSDLAFTPATELAEMIRSKEVSPVELTEMYLDRIEKFDPELNSYVTVAGEQALEDAKSKEQQLAGGVELPAFHGVPISVKDLFETKGLRTTLSCSALKDYVPDQDDFTVAKIRAAGFVILGKTNTSEFGSIPVAESDLNGITRNPWDTGHTPGGSSGGAAAGVAAGLAPVAHGSDGGGSIRIPASCCGIFGHKPSRGRVSSGPRLGEAWHGFSTQGPIGRTVKDTAALLDVLTGYQTGDPYWLPEPTVAFRDEVGRDPGRLRIAFTTTSPNEIPAHGSCVAATEDAARLLESLGHEVTETAPDWVDQELAPTFIKLVMSGLSLVDFLKDGMEPLNRYLVDEASSAMSATDHMQSLLQAHQWARKVVAFWDDYDVLVTPTLAQPPIPVGWIREDDDPWSQLIRSGQFIPYTPAANVTGQPAASVPLHWDDDGLPIGVQLIGPPGGDAPILRLSAQLESARPWADRRPAIS